jgi:hypothetical protein
LIVEAFAPHLAFRLSPPCTSRGMWDYRQLSTYFVAGFPQIPSPSSPSSDVLIGTQATSTAWLLHFRTTQGVEEPKRAAPSTGPSPTALQPISQYDSVA